MRTPSKRLSSPLLVALAAPLLGFACGEPEEKPLGVTSGPSTAGDATSGGSAGDSATGTESGSGSGSDSGTGAGSTGSTGSSGSSGGEVLTCADVQCTGNGTCVENDDGAVCACNEGYILDGTNAHCVLDESCIEIRELSESCRTRADGVPAVSMFFAIDFCAGTAVLPEKMAELGLEFSVLENGNDVTASIESAVTVIDKEVESFVTLAIDASDSLTQSENLPTLMTELRQFVAALQPAPGGSRVYVSIMLFGRGAREYVYFTEDFAALDQALQEFAADPAAVLTALDTTGQGTQLYDAVEKSINRTTGARLLRDSVSRGGVLATGTVVVITDGNDTSNDTLDTGLIKNTVNQVVSIGVSSDVSADELHAVGRDGAFLAPSPEQWPAVFDELTTRVQQYPERSYLLAYCSSASVGTSQVELTLKGSVVPVQTAGCSFNASDFGTGADDICNASLFATECDAQECGGLTACGGCADDACCTGTTCAAATVLADSCANNDAACAATDQICVALTESTFECQTPPAIGEPCVPAEGCAPGVAYCSADEVCVAARPLGATCTALQECESLHCAKTNPDNAFEPMICQPPARHKDACTGDAVAACSDGFYCASQCQALKSDLEKCTTSKECLSFNCATTDNGKMCLSANQCFWDWGDALTGA